MPGNSRKNAGSGAPLARVAALAIALSASLSSCREGWQPWSWFAHTPVDVRVRESLESPLAHRFIIVSKPFAIAQISDLHAEASGWPGAQRFLSWLDGLAPEDRPALVVATGDLTDGGLASQFAHIEAFAAELESRGVAFAATPGNHEFYVLEGWDNWKAGLRTGLGLMPAFGTIDLGPAPGTAELRVVLADSADGTFGSVQWPEIERAILGAGSSPLVFATHMMAYGSFVESTIYRLESQRERARIASLLNRPVFTAYVGGHEHLVGIASVGAGTHYATCGASMSHLETRTMTLITVPASGEPSIEFLVY
jgi:3',5'-cyclic AMP phosphodiesterase CpdA